MSIIDLRSDTISFPSEDMLRFMATSDAGDDEYSEAKRVNELQEYAADLLGKEAALFMPSGTMSNQATLRSLASAGDEVITEYGYHISWVESAQTAAFGSCVILACKTQDGFIRPMDVVDAFHSRPRRNSTYPAPKLIVLENSINAYGGRIFPLDLLSDLYSFSSAKKLHVHLDGARVFNAAVKLGVPIRTIARHVDSLSLCFAKGLAAPFGALVAGPAGFISELRRWRKWYGGQLHNASYIASGALFALKHNVERLQDDNDNAALLGAAIEEIGFPLVYDVETNIVVFDCNVSGLTADAFVAQVGTNGLLLKTWGLHSVRAVTHNGITAADIKRAAMIMRALASNQRHNAA